ncbi:hypothetical protein CQA53_07295 [Helicobacter didelphidarum]|uniref:DUF1049 domain-containing protein n=1 Tax=Helicobacter didelphidarum TaxID=2040648 RepID=A0A3D8IK57_9HELI|nr:hypothetical protein [Helicobacter didelphidarum]RDU64951.1 hypothetical protein CQA53_07295 [Helicobacter didelphidarum]
MRIRYFLVFGIIYIALIGGYTFYIIRDNYSLNNTLWIDFSVTLPIAVWMCLPIIALFFMAWFFMALNTLILKFKGMSFNRDVDKIITQIYEQMLGNDSRDRIFANHRFKEVSRVLKRFYLLPHFESNPAGNKQIDDTFDMMLEIQNNTSIPKIKLHTKHPLFLKNAKNMISNDAQKAFETLKQDFSQDTLAHKLYKEINTQSIYDAAWTVLIENKNSKLINKILNLNNIHMSFDVIIKLILHCANNTIEIQQDSIIKICKNINLSEKEYLNLAIQLSKVLNENNVNFYLNLFEKLSKEIEASVFAYFFLLLEVSKTSEAMELKKQYPKNDFLPVSAFCALKDQGYPLLVFFDPLLYRANKANKNQILPNINAELMQTDYH